MGPSIILIVVQTRNIQLSAPAGPGFLTGLWHALGLSLWVILLKVLNRVRVVHPENRPGRGEHDVLILCNHISAVDPFVIAATAMPFASPVWWRAPAKEELFRMPIVRNLLGSWGAFPVRRGKHDREAIETMIRLVKSSVIVIFPEGTRSRDGRLLPGKAGVGRVIYDARPAKIIPVFIEGSDRVLPNGRILPRLFQTVTITYGAPLDLSSFFQYENSLAVSQRMADAVMRAIDRLRPAAGGPIQRFRNKPS